MDVIVVRETYYYDGEKSLKVFATLDGVNEYLNEEYPDQDINVYKTPEVIYIERKGEKGVTVTIDQRPILD